MKATDALYRSEYRMEELGRKNKKAGWYIGNNPGMGKPFGGDVQYLGETYTLPALGGFKELPMGWGCTNHGAVIFWQNAK